jgi:hypothetical protein
MAANINIVSTFDDKSIKTAQKELDKLGEQSKGFASRMSSGFSKAGSSLANFGKKLALASAAAGAGALVIGKKLIEAGERASTSNARLEQINKSMGLFGDSTGQVTDRLIKLAEATARSTGVDQNSIKATQAKLLTFKELAATADQVGGEFDRATKAAIDLAAAGFGEAESNAVQLGKALNDPIKGITALTRSGVTFTQAEQERIKALVKSNKVGEAQQMILGAIETQVGGTAEATANATDRMRVMFGQLQERIGLKLLPVFNRLAAFVMDRLYPAVDRFARIAMGRLKEIFQSIRPFLERVGDIIDKYVRPVIEKIIDFMKNNEDAVKAFFLALAGLAVIAMLAGLLSALGALLTPIGLIVAAIALLVGAFVWAYQNVDWFRTGADAVGRWFRDKFPEYFRAFATALRAIWDGLWEVLLAIGRWFQRTWLDEDSKWRAGVIYLWNTMFAALSRLVRGVFDIIVEILKGFVNIFQGIWNVFMGVITLDWSRAWEGIKQIFEGVVGILKAVLMTLVLPFQVVWAAFGDELSLVWRMVWYAITTVVGKAFDIIKSLFNGAKDVILGIWNFVVGGILAGVEAIVNGVQRAVDAVRNLPNSVPGVGIAKGAASVIGGIVGGAKKLIPGLANGGLVNRPTFAMVGEAGPEVVIPLDRLNGMGGGQTVIVNVQGSVVSERDLIEQIRVGLLRSQRSGKRILA